MNKGKTLKLAISAMAGLLVASTAWAAVPAPPVNQYLGIGDTVFNMMVEADCRVCHSQTPLAGYPVDPTYLPDRHHLLVDTPIPSPTDVPTPDADGDGTPDVNYDCLNCHSMVWTGTTWELDPNFRDCTECHIQTGTSGPTVHHRTTEAQAGDCAFCHGSFVDDGLSDDDLDGIRNAIDPDGGWVPSYQVSLVTPYPGGVFPPSGLRKPNGDDATTNVWGMEAGNCSFCHSNLTGTPGEFAVENTGVFQPVQVYINYDTHHTTGFIGDSAKCVWCHDGAIGPNGDQTAVTPIRVCENCHGIPSLHNIQYDGQAAGFPNNGGTVTPGAEPAGFGHIGNQDDCWGCHGNNGVPMSAPSSGPVIPGLYSLSASSVQAGDTLVLSGTAFVNEVQNPMTGEFDITLASQVALTDAAGFETILAPISCTGDTIEVQIPATMPAGNYQIAANKAGTLSNPLNLAITPELAVTAASCTDGLMSIAGTGFSSYLAAADSGTSVTATVTYEVVEGKGKNKTVTTVTETMVGEVLSWSDSAIEASFPACADQVTVDTVFDAVVAPVEVIAPPVTSCEDYADEASCSDDPACAWDVNKKGVGSCKDAGNTGGGGGKPPKDK